MADSDQNAENKEAGGKVEQPQAPSKKKTTKKKAAKKQVRKKTAKKKAVKKAVKPAPEIVSVKETAGLEATPKATEVIAEGHEKVQEHLQEMQKAQPGQSATGEMPQEKVSEQAMENRYIVGLWVVVAVVCLIFINALSSRPAGKPAPMPEEEPAPAATHSTAVPEQPDSSTLFQDVSPEKLVSGERGAPGEAAPESAMTTETSRGGHDADERVIAPPGETQPQTPPGSPPGRWIYVPHESDLPPSESSSGKSTTLGPT